MKNYRLARTGCCFISSFFIHTSSFAFGRHRAAQMRRAARSNRQWRKFPVCFEQSQISGRIHLNNFGVNRSRARDQTNFRCILDHMIIGNQTTVVRDENTVPVWPFINTWD